MRLRFLALVWTVLLCSSCGLFHHNDAPPPAVATPTPVPPLITRRGEEHTLQEAMNGIGFKPFVPQHVSIVAVALLPAFSGEDYRKNRGIGIEYENAGRLYALSEWPSNGMSVEGTTPVGTEAGCDIASFRRDGFTWANPVFVYTFQPDGNVAPALVLREAKRIIRAGACR